MQDNEPLKEEALKKRHYIELISFKLLSDVFACEEKIAVMSFIFIVDVAFLSCYINTHEE